MRLAADALGIGEPGRLMFVRWRLGGGPGTSSHPYATLIETQCHGLDLLEHLRRPITSVMGQISVTGLGSPR